MVFLSIIWQISWEKYQRNKTCIYFNVFFSSVNLSVILLLTDLPIYNRNTHQNIGVILSFYYSPYHTTYHPIYLFMVEVLKFGSNPPQNPKKKTSNSFENIKFNFGSPMWNSKIKIFHQLLLHSVDSTMKTLTRTFGKRNANTAGRVPHKEETI